MSKLAARLQEAAIFRQQGKLAQARATYEKILKQSPTNHDALRALAAMAGQSRDFPRALRLLDQLLKLKPDDAGVHCNRGLVLHELDSLEAAVASYERAIALREDYAVAHYNLGNSLSKLGRMQAAVTSYAHSIAADPCFAPAYYNRGVAQQSLNEWQAALASYLDAVKLKPDWFDPHYNAAVVLQALGRWPAALASYDAALALEPENAAAYSNRGVVLGHLRQSQAALESFNRAITLKPDFANAHFNRANTLYDLKQYPTSVASYNLAASLGSDAVGLLGSRRHAKMQICDWSDCHAETLELTGAIKSFEPATSPFHVLLMSDSGALQQLAARSWVRSQCPPDPTMPAVAKMPRHDKIRIGYFSADFHNHATSYLMAQLFEEHDARSFETTLFSFGPDYEDVMRSRIKSACRQFFDVLPRTDAEIATLARDLQIDIAVDLKGFTQFSRPEIFARRAAPVQVSYLGYPGTMGAQYIDYLIADRCIIPAGHEGFYDEKIVFMPHSYQVNDAKRTIADVRHSREELGLPPTGFVFCCFNNNFKIVPEIFEVWMRLLRRVPGSVLWLYEDNKDAAGNLRREARNRGVDVARLIFAPSMPLAQHLARHHAADLFLDTWPCNAHTTASDALWAGLPLVTLTGEAFASRVAASLLTAVGMPELITSSIEEYENLSIKLASDPQLLSQVRQKLEQHRSGAPLFDTRRTVRHLEAAYRSVYERYQADLPTDHISIDPG